MRGYVPTLIPDTLDIADLKLWFAQQLDLISEAIPAGDIIKLPVRYTAPEKPRNGMIVYADGTQWDPGSGEGFYGYESGAWVKL